MNTEIHLFRQARATRDLAAGETLFQIGDPGDTMFAVLDGSVELRLNG